MNKDKLVSEILTAKAEKNNTIDLDAYANGLADMFDKLVNKTDTISYCGEQGEENIKSEIKEIMHACGDSNEFTRLCNEAQSELDEDAFDLDQESRMNGV